MIVFHLKLRILKLRSLSLTYSEKKKDVYTDKLANNWQIFARDRFQLKFAL